MITLRHQGLIYDLRPLTESDLEAALRLYRQPEACLTFERLPPVDMDNVEVDIEVSQEDGRHYYGIFHPAGALVGLVDYLPADNRDDPGNASIYLLFISPPDRAEGLGETVVRAVEAELRRDPRLCKILVGVQSKNAYALKFWKANGYQLTSGVDILPGRDELSIFEKECTAAAPHEWGIDF